MSLEVNGRVLLREKSNLVTGTSKCLFEMNTINYRLKQSDEGMQSTVWVSSTSQNHTK